VLTIKADLEEMIIGIRHLDQYYKTMQEEHQNRILVRVQ
jgi:hypothetical protein